MQVKNNEIEQVKSVCRQQIQGMLSKNIGLLSMIISHDADFVHITGKHQSKDDWLDQIKSGRMEYFSAKEELLEVTLSNKTAHVVMRNLLEARIYGFRNTWPIEAQTELVKINDVWRIVRSKADMY
ncbi:nuclear transport factor 2 family protein [Companilactobacillus keshanensis]|uniref:Nuclear transport factor 2 family protein n=1 Tax=Companilactobacillus keshanensis TaxID=2486003 RepID=A0ABW4BTE3_9LACO|nr:nuclear transport factor 2 family protein [Companilactobacillus keshanensis]